eukprot:scaffold17801_cov63-Phaeocystis_antarctica.AAC.4
MPPLSASLSCRDSVGCIRGLDRAELCDHGEARGLGKHQAATTRRRHDRQLLSPCLPRYHRPLFSWESRRRRARAGSAALTGDFLWAARARASGSKPARPRHLALLRRALRGRKVDELSAWRRRGILCGRVLVV